MKKDFDWHKEAKRLGLTDKMLNSWTEKEKRAFVRKALKKAARRKRMRVKKRKGWS